VQSYYNNHYAGSLKGLWLRGAEDPVDPITPSDPPLDDGEDPGPDPETPTPEPKTYSEEYVKKLRDENAKYRTERNTLQKEKDEKARAEMAEVDRLKLEKEEAETRVKEIEASLSKERIAYAISRAAAAANFHAPDDAAAFIRTDSIKLNDDGTPDGRSVKSAVEALAKDKPHLVRGTGSGDGGYQGTPPSGAQRVQEIEEQLKSSGMVKVG